jgi:hypothetical protein
MVTNWIKKLPTTSMSSLLDSVLLDINLPVGEEIIEGGYWELNRTLIKKIREANGLIVRAKTKDEAVMADTKARLFKEEQKKIVDLSRHVAVKSLLRRVYVGTAYLNGEVVIVPSRAWSGKIDWEEERLVFAHHEYSHYRIITHGHLTDEQLNLVTQYASEDIDAQRDNDRLPGRPSNMHLVEQKLRQRSAARELNPSMNEEADFLEKWFKKNHPDKKAMTAKAIGNKYRSLYRELKGKSA